MEYTLKEVTVFNIYQFTTPDTYDTPLQPEPAMIPSPFFYGKTYRTRKGAEKAIARICKLSNTPVEDFEIRTAIEEEEVAA